jgi:hypothetical protein
MELPECSLGRRQRLRLRLRHDGSRLSERVHLQRSVVQQHRVFDLS